MDLKTDELPGCSCYVVSWRGVSSCMLTHGTRKLKLDGSTLFSCANHGRGLSVRSRKALVRIIQSGQAAHWEDLTESMLLSQRNCGITATREILKFVSDGRHWAFSEQK